MKGLVILITITLLLASFVVAREIGITSSVTDNITELSNSKEECTNNCPIGCASPADRICASNGQKYCNTCTMECYGLKEAEDSSLCEKAGLTIAQTKNIILARNKLKLENRTGIACPTSCTCTKSTMKCILLNGREMTVYAGNSGNVIVQVKGENMTTNVSLYKSSDGKVYGIFKNNETKRVRMLPDQVKEKVKEKLEKHLENENMSLDENGAYKYQADRKSKLFAFIPITIRVRAEIDSETGNIIKISKNPWWGFLAKDENSEQVLGASCGTASQGTSNDACCITKGYNTWNANKQQCEFSD